MLGSFFKNLVGVKAEQTSQDFMTLLVRWDPKGCTLAELRTMEEKLDNLGLEVAQARSAYDKEQREADAILLLQSQRLAAAEMLEAAMNAATDPQARAAQEASLTTMLGLLEGMAEEIDREVAEAKDAKDFLDMLEGAYQQAGTKLRTAKADLEKAERDMKRAEVQRDMAERRAETARQAAGLASATSGMTTALAAMRQQAEADNNAAAAANAKAALLKPTKPEETDPNIAAAMAAAQGKATQPTSLAERLAQIKAKAA